MKKTILKIGWAITRFGDRHKLRFLTYNPITWAFFFVSGRRAGAVFAAVIREKFPEVDTALDVGAGTGGYVSNLNNLAIRTIGVEYSAVGRFLGKLQGAHLIPFDCSRPERNPVLGRFDLVFTIEVGEHIPESLSPNFVDFIARHGDFVIFSSAFPGQGGHGHINEKPKEFWQSLFKQSGFDRFSDLEDALSTSLIKHGYRGWLPKNIMVFRKARN
jgi:hypothetical protein